MIGGMRGSFGVGELATGLVGRGADDFNELSVRLADHGYIAAAINALDIALATLVGHGFGNRVAQLTASEYPELVESVLPLADEADAFLSQP